MNPPTKSFFPAASNGKELAQQPAPMQKIDCININWHIKMIHPSASGPGSVYDRSLDDRRGFESLVDDQFESLLDGLLVVLHLRPGHDPFVTGFHHMP